MRTLDLLMGGEKAGMVFTDPPYNLKISRVQGRGRIKHGGFAFADGEMTEDQYTAFLKAGCQNIARVCVDGAIVFICEDWRHVVEMLNAARSVFGKRRPQATFLRTGVVAYAQGRSSSRRFCGWPLTMRVMTSAR
jgi:hypothetical protein